MEFDFYELFKNYSTPDLLLILKKPGDYQPEALAAARKLLTDREITAADEAEANARAITGKKRRQAVPWWKRRTTCCKQLLLPGLQVAYPVGICFSYCFCFCVFY